jgi:hypothetical protein
MMLPGRNKTRASGRGRSASDNMDAANTVVLTASKRLQSFSFDPSP